MARISQPWFRRSKNTWYCTMEGRKVSLGVKGENSQAEAIKAWHRLFAGERTNEVSQSESKGRAEDTSFVRSHVSVKEVVDGFLGGCAVRVTPNTLRVRKHFLLPFAAAHGKRNANDLTPEIAEAWSRKPNWNDGTRHDFLKTLTTAFHWAERARLLERSPLLGLRKPPKQSRGVEAIIKSEEHEKLHKAAAEHFKPFLRFLYLTGCRPGEASAITANTFDEENAVVCLGYHKTAHKGKSRTLFLSPDAVAILKEQKQKHGEGHLFKNRKGKPWKCQAIVKAMIATRNRAGVSKAICYGYRHGFATDALAITSACKILTYSYWRHTGLTDVGNNS